jgi:molybdopterin molybdotransferase
MGTEFLKIKECDEAIDIIQNLFNENLKPESEEILVSEAYGRVLFEDVYSRMDFPPFDKALKDGFAILSSDSFGASEESPNTLEVIDFLEAGSTTDKKVEPGKCIEISTGAAMPEGSDAVLMVEYAEKDDGKVNLLTTVTPTQDVAKKGSDIEEGKLILKKGDFLNPGKIGVLLSQGFESIEVFKKPSVGILSSGNEITLQGEELDYGKIYDVNGGMIKNDAISCGADAKFLGIMHDDYDEVKEKITKSLEEVDILFCSGGTSAGLGDVLKHVLDELGESTNRNAHFTCSMTLINPSGEIEYKYQGICEGEITKEVRGSNGFGYDPIFLVKGDTRTMAELSEEEKNKISHRSVALRHVLEYLKKRTI